MKRKRNYTIVLTILIQIFGFTLVFGQEFKKSLTCQNQEMTSSSMERVEAQSAKVDGKFYIFAGFEKNLKITDATEIYDPATNNWFAGAPMPVPVSHMGIAVVGSEIWILGGFEGDHPGPATDIVQIYDTRTDAWFEGVALPELIGSGAAAFNNGKVHFFGGLEADRQTDKGNHYVFDTTAESATWTAAPELPEPRNHLSSAVINGKIYAIGGQFGHDVTFSDQNFLHVYDPSLGEWEEKASLPAQRSHFEPGTDVYDNKIVIVGGRHGPAFFDKITMYDPDTDIWTEVCSISEKLLAPAAKIFGNELIVANGGIDGTCCPTSDVVKITLVESTLTLGNTDNRTYEFNIAPNPATKVIHVRGSFKELGQDVKLQVLNLQGTLILDQELTSDRNTINVDKLPKGMYLIALVKENKRTSVKKFLKS